MAYRTLSEPPPYTEEPGCPPPVGPGCSEDRDQARAGAVEPPWSPCALGRNHSEPESPLSCPASTQAERDSPLFRLERTVSAALPRGGEEHMPSSPLRREGRGGGLRVDTLLEASPEPAEGPRPPPPTPSAEVGAREPRGEARCYDSTQEIRAMILAALPYPPLPVVVERLDEDNRVVGQVTQTSHDLISSLLLHACARKDRSENARRRERQTRILRSLLDHMANRGQLQSAPELYETYCHHTRLHVATFSPRDSAGAPPIRFEPLSSVCKGDPTHRRMCDYMAGQAVLLEEPNGRSAQDWLCREYADMLTLNRARLLSDPSPALGTESGDDDEGST